VLNGEAANTNFIVFGLIRPGLKPRSTTRCQRANHYINDAAQREDIPDDMNNSNQNFSVALRKVTIQDNTRFIGINNARLQRPVFNVANIN
jgi:hypothetical protein